MTTTIIQKVLFKNTSASILYRLYTNSKLHTLATGAVANINTKHGARFMAQDGYISGKNLQVIPNKLIVQAWRASDWLKTDVDSTFIVLFEPKGNDVVLHVTHANLPTRQADSINKGWYHYYWKPWKQYLAGKKIPG